MIQDGSISIFTLPEGVLEAFALGQVTHEYGQPMAPFARDWGDDQLYRELVSIMMQCRGCESPLERRVLARADGGSQILFICVAAPRRNNHPGRLSDYFGARPPESAFRR